MPKWVVKRPEHSRHLEIWEYIDTVEEAKQYWYIRQAICKYGAENVVPLAMNRFGGYHHLPINSKEIVRIIESEAQPDISVFELYPPGLPQIQNGWMAPDASIFTCGAYGHLDCAEKLCSAFQVRPYDPTGPDETLLAHGWIKILSRTWFGNWRAVTDKQIQEHERLGVKRRFME